MIARRVWSPADDELVRTLFPDTRTADLAVKLGRHLSAVYQRAYKLGLRKSADYLASPAACRLRRGDNPGVKTRYVPGHVPMNKGLRRPGWAPGRMRETQFKAGTPSWRYMPIGSTRLIDGYLYRKVSDVPKVAYTVNWKPEHILVWTAAHGPVPPRHAIAFKNRNNADIRLANLECIPRVELMKRNSVHNLPAPLPQTIQLLGALNRRINRRRREKTRLRISATICSRPSRRCRTPRSRWKSSAPRPSRMSRGSSSSPRRRRSPS